jgi:diguanylate cyclase (GGDEF)-like protein
MQMTILSSLKNTQLLDSACSRTEVRQRFLDGISAEMSIALADGSRLAILLVDLQDFTEINREIGYDSADEVLLNVQQLLSSTIKRASLIGRLGDNVFGLIIPELKSTALIQIAMGRIRERLHEPTMIDGKKISLKCHFGLALFPEMMLDGGGLLLKAETALLDSKRNPSEMTTHAPVQCSKKHEDWTIEKHLKQALDANDLEFHYQPKIDIARRKPTGIEALVRWNSAELGNVFPDEFIPIAEKSSLINSITALGIKTALREKSDLDNCFEPLTMSINISSSDIYDKHLLDKLNSAMAIWGIDPQQVTLEITEGVIVGNAKLAIQQLELLRSYGIKISIDDFGTGFSSLSYFKTLPADELKIDKSFILNMHESSGDMFLVEHVISLAHKFNLQVVAEGVENAKTLSLLESMGCDIAQGYHFSQPVPKDQLLAWLNNFKDAKYWI